MEFLQIPDRRKWGRDRGNAIDYISLSIHLSLSIYLSFLLSLSLSLPSLSLSPPLILNPLPVKVWGPQTAVNKIVGDVEQAVHALAHSQVCVC